MGLLNKLIRHDKDSSSTTTASVDSTPASDASIRTKDFVGSEPSSPTSAVSPSLGTDTIGASITTEHPTMLAEDVASRSEAHAHAISTPEATHPHATLPFAARAGAGQVASSKSEGAHEGALEPPAKEQVSSAATVLDLNHNQATVVVQEPAVEPKGSNDDTSTTGSWFSKLIPAVGGGSGGSVVEEDSTKASTVSDASAISVVPSSSTINGNAGHHTGEGVDSAESPVDKLPVSSLRGAASANRTSTIGSISDVITEDFDPAPSKTDADFRKLFPTVQDDVLIEDYRCALSREILIQGRLYVGERYLGFKANVLGWETSAVIPFDEVVSIEKRNTALVVPNAIEIATASGKHTFASFFNRDTTYALIVAVWRHHADGPRVRDTSDGQSLAPTTKLRSLSDHNDGSTTDEEGSIIAFEDDHGGKKSHRFRAKASSIIPDALKIRALRSSPTLTASQTVKADSQLADAVNDAAAAAGKHQATEYTGPQFSTSVLDTVIPTSPEKFHHLVMQDKEFLTQFLTAEDLREIKVGEWTKAGEGALEKRELSYIRPLSGSIGPKQTLCEVTELQEHLDTEDYISIKTVSKTPDVPCGDGFFVQSRLVLTWTSSGSTRVQVSTEVEFSQVNRMLKGIINKSAIEGQKAYYQALSAAIKSHIKANPAEFAIAGAVEEPDSEVKELPASGNDGGVSSTALSYLSDVDPIFFLGGLVLLLALTNMWTLSRGRSSTRIGEPVEVAAQVERLLEQFKASYASTGGSLNVRSELETVIASLAEMEKQVSFLRARVAGIAVKVL